jgi:hypothetical protein
MIDEGEATGVQNLLLFPISVGTGIQLNEGHEIVE